MAKKNYGPTKLKKVVTPKPKLPKPLKLRFGAPNEMGDVREFDTEPQLRRAIIAELRGLEPWCARYNNAGIEAINLAILEVENMVIVQDKRRISCHYDEYYDLRIVFEYWRTI
jgi:hypothetical protein